ncbi:MAG TPA: hypothetical protein VKA32_00865 [Gammaproteobacteria bacterium]|nr:hypothetical protein [Gammaproteobacteria bacterium]
MTKPVVFLILCLVGTLCATDPAVAYVGPGAGLSLLGALWGLVLAVGAAIGFVVMWPLRQARRRARLRKLGAQNSRHDADSDALDDR